MSWYDTYANQSFDNDGMVSRSSSTVSGDTWKETGTTTDSKGKTYHTRITTTFSPDGKMSTTKGEFSADGGKTFVPWWDSAAKKVGK